MAYQSSNPISEFRFCAERFQTPSALNQEVLWSVSKYRGLKAGSEFKSTDGTGEIFPFNLHNFVS